MRIYKSLFFCALIFLPACKSNEKVPADLLPMDRMTAVLVQIHLVDGKLLNITQAPDSLYKYGTGNYIAMFKYCHTDSTQFDRSFKYYTHHPEKLDEIYDDVVKTLQAKSDSIAKQKPKNALPAK